MPYSVWFQTFFKSGLNMGIARHPAVDLKSKETVSFCAILVGESSANPVADHHAADSWSGEESVAAALWE